MTGSRINYRKIIREMYKSICRDEYPTKAKFTLSEVSSEIQKRIQTRGNKIGSTLESYRIREEGGVFYKNPYVYDFLDVLVSLPYYFTNPLGRDPPTGITGSGPEAEERQRDYGRTIEGASRVIEKSIGKKVHNDILLAWVEREHNDRIRKGVDGYYYVVPE